MMPVPTHLVDCVRPDDDIVNEADLRAAVCCPCGATQFDLLFPGQTRTIDGQTFPVTAKVDGSYFFIITARCTACQRQHLLLDSHFHGWNGFVCHDPQQASLPRPPLIEWKCLACGGSPHSANVFIQTEGKADFVSEGAGEIDVDRWPDGFGCFNMGIQCVACGKQTTEWVSYETM